MPEEPGEVEVEEVGDEVLEDGVSGGEETAEEQEERRRNGEAAQYREE